MDKQLLINFKSAKHNFDNIFHQLKIIHTRYYIIIINYCGFKNILFVITFHNNLIITNYYLLFMK